MGRRQADEVGVEGGLARQQLGCRAGGRVERHTVGQMDMHTDWPSEHLVDCRTGV